MINATSVKDRLKFIAKTQGRTMQDILVTYGLERSVYRLSISKYNEYFTLKGGVFLYGLFNGNFARATRDIDLLGSHISNDVDIIKKVFLEIFSISGDDGIVFDIGTLNAKKITESKKYTGINISIIGYLDRTRIPVSIDIGFGDKIYPSRMLMNFPTLLREKSPSVYAYSIYSVISEKFEAFVSLGYIIVVIKIFMTYTY